MAAKNKVPVNLALFLAAGFLLLSPVGASATIYNVAIQPGATGNDVWLEGTYNKNYYDFLIVGKSSTYQKKRTVIQFSDLSAIPADATILKAEMSVYHHGYGCVSGESAINRTVYLNEILASWTESQATSAKRFSSIYWNTPYVGLNDIDARSYSEGSLLWSVGNYGWKTYTVTNLVASWLNGNSSNNGVILWAGNEDTPGCDMRFRSSEYSVAAYRPKLYVEYSVPPVTLYWNESYVGLNNIDAKSTPEVTVNVASGSYGWHQFFLKNLVGKWVNRMAENRGVLLWATNEDVPDACDMRFRSSEYSDFTMRPNLSVVYTVNGTSYFVSLVQGINNATGEDVWVEDTTNKNSYDLIIIGKHNLFPKKRSLVKIDVSSIPENAVVNWAVLTLYRTYDNCYGGGAPITRPVQVHQVLSEWKESEATRDVRLS